MTKTAALLLACLPLLVGLSVLGTGLVLAFRRIHTVVTCSEETEGRAVDYILSRFKSAPFRRSLGLRRRGYSLRWHPVYRYCAAGEVIVRKSRACILSDSRPPEMAVKIRYNPKAPGRYYVPGQRWNPGWLGTALFLYDGVLFTAAGVLAFLIVLTAESA